MTQQANQTDPPYSALSESLQSLAETITRKSRLIRKEKQTARQTITNELTKRVAAGEDESEILAAYSNPKRRARQLKRTARRHRAFIWHLLIWSWRLCLLLLTSYPVFAIYLAMGTITPSVNYLAMRQEVAATVPEQERAWPIFREVMIKYDFEFFDVSLLTTADDKHIFPGDEDWPAFKESVSEYENFLLEICELTKKKGFGLVLHNKISKISPEDKAFLLSEKQIKEAMASPDEPIFTTWDTGLDLSLIRNTCRLLKADTRIAIAEKNLPRVIRNMKAMIQLAQYMREFGTLIADITGAGLHTSTMLSLQALIHDRCDLLTRDQLIMLNREIAFGKRHFELQNMRYRLHSYELVQRMYPSHGFVNHKTIDKINSLDNDIDSSIPRSPLLMPIMALFAGTRDQVLRSDERLWQKADAFSKRPMWEQMHTELILEPPPQKYIFNKFMVRVVAIFIMPAMDVACSLLGSAKGTHEVTLILLQLELYRKDHGAYPVELKQLIPEYLTDIPIDHSTGKPLIYRLEAGKPLIYGRGIDGDDDGGTEIENWKELGSDGDWVLYPVKSIRQFSAHLKQTDENNSSAELKAE